MHQVSSIITLYNLTHYKIGNSFRYSSIYILSLIAIGSRLNSSRVATTPLLAACDSPDHFSRLNSLSLLDPNPIPMNMEVAADVPIVLDDVPLDNPTDLPMDIPLDLPSDVEVPPPPAKRARARYIFQRCLIPTQDGRDRLGELLAPDSDTEEG